MISQLLPLAAPPRVQVLHPGDVACGEAGDRLETLLGSCVAIVLTDPRHTVACMSHVVHAGPAARGKGQATAHGDAALAEMGRRLVARGLEPRLCQAWLFGGGNMFPGQVGEAAHEGNVGAANVAWARQALARAGIALCGGETGGSAYRRLRWTVGARAPELHTVPLDAAGVSP